MRFNQSHVSVGAVALLILTLFFANLGALAVVVGGGAEWPSLPFDRGEVTGSAW